VTQSKLIQTELLVLSPQLSFRGLWATCRFTDTSLSVCLCKQIIATLLKMKVTDSVAPEPEGSSPHSQQPANGPYPEPGESTPLPPPPTNLPKVSIFRCLGRFAKESVLVRGSLERCVTNLGFYGGGMLAPPAQPPSRSTTLCRLSATAYSIYSQLPNIP
jgi:hypothetical protein